MMDRRFYRWVFTATIITLIVLAQIGVLSSPSSDKNERVIKIALYPLKTGSDNFLKQTFNYAWCANGKLYRFDVHVLTFEEIRSKDFYSNLKNYDVFIAGASYLSYLVDGKSDVFKKSIERFLSDGGGFYGVCAGAFLASQGYENPDNWFEKETNKGVLRIANVYLNCDFDGELQYLLKEASWLNPRFGQIPIEVKVNKSSPIPIFKPFKKEVFNISYGGGAGLYIADSKDSRLGKIYPLLIYNEELMETKPIHFWKRALIGWKKGETIKTDLKGDYAMIATTFNNSGRIVLISSHPEIPVMLNGTIVEFFGRNTLGIPRIVYAWYNGTRLNISKNLWIHRRVVAWLAKVPDEDLPPIEEAIALISKPTSKPFYGIYINDKKFISSKFLTRILSKLGMSIIVGKITVVVYAEGIERIEFLLDNEMKFIDYNPPFEWKIEEPIRGRHSIKVIAYSNETGSFVWDEGHYLFI